MITVEEIGELISICDRAILKALPPAYFLPASIRRVIASAAVATVAESLAAGREEPTRADLESIADQAFLRLPES